MRRHLTIAAMLLVAAACDEPTTPTTDAGPSFSRVPINQSAAPLDLAVIGDVPYGDAALAQFPTLVASINQDPKVRTVIHIGDIKSGSTECSDAWFEEMASQFDAFKDPLVYAIGDNEWTDCHRANNGAYDPLGRLAKIREIFFSAPGSTLGGRNKGVEAAPGYPEDRLWVESRVTFAVFHEIGSNNGLDEWFGGVETPQQTADREAEVAGRQAANLAWLDHAFDTADREESVGVLIFFHADLWHPDDRADGAVFSAHDSFVAKLAELASDFGGPVLLVSGDSHDFRVDAGVPWFSLYGVTPPANVTQIIVDRTIEDDINWLRVHIDPASSDVFSWEQVIFVP